LEYTQDKLAAFISAAVSNTSYKRKDYFLYLDDDPLQETDRYNFAGFSIKGGANYNLDGRNNVFANLGYFEKAPGFDAVFTNFNNTDINKNAENQKILSFELGYGYRSEKLNANLNLYRTEWKDRTLSRYFVQPDGSTAYANILGINALHQGIELDFAYRPSSNLTFTGMLSLGDWKWENNIEGVEIRDEDQNLISTVNLYIKDLHVGDAAQTTMALGMNYKVGEKSRFTVDYNYYDRLYANYDPNSRGTEGAPDAWRAPDYGVFDTTFSHGFKFGMFDATLTGRLDNVFDTHYVSDAFDGSNSNALTSRVWYGFGRTFSIGAKLEF
jgi:outer membrane receptor for Fe3+-dicitrate